MYDTYRTAGRGLHLIFLGQIFCLFSFIPLLGAFLSIAGLILHILGLNTAKSAHPSLQNAFMVAIINVVVAVVSIFVAPLGIVITILSLVEFYYICNGACALLADKGDHYQADNGRRVWKLYMGCMVVTIICTALAFIPILGLLALVVAVIAAIVLLVAGILFIIFLYKAHQSLMS